MWHFPSSGRHRMDVRYQLSSPQVGLCSSPAAPSPLCPGQGSHQDIAALLAQPQNTARLSPPGPQIMGKPLAFLSSSSLVKEAELPQLCFPAQLN